jgi:hypothetical protein
MIYRFCATAFDRFHGWRARKPDNSGAKVHPGREMSPSLPVWLAWRAIFQLVALALRV